MDFKRKAVMFAIWNLLLPTCASAYFSQSDQGEEVFSFMSTFDSPRNAALEKATSAVPSSDPTIVQLNPGALRLPDGTNRIAEIHWQTGAMADNQGSISYTSSYKKFLYQISYNWLDYGTIVGYDEYGMETGTDYNPLSQLATATVSYAMTHINVGATVKFASESLADDAGDRTAWGAAFDWGISWQSVSKIFGIGIVARDFGMLLRDYVDDDIDEYYPMSQMFGLSMYYRPVILPRLTIMAVRGNELLYVARDVEPCACKTGADKETLSERIFAGECEFRFCIAREIAFSHDGEARENYRPVVHR